MTQNLLDELARSPRVRVRNERAIARDGRAVVYWMQRAQRGRDNPALDLAIEAGNALGLPVAAFMAPVPFFPNGNERHYAFLLEGLEDVAKEVEARGVCFVFRTHPHHRIERFCKQVRAALVIGDENPLRETERWRLAGAERLSMPLLTVDADVVVPTALLDKLEWAARTIRPRIHERLAEWLDRPPERKAKHAFSDAARPKSEPIDVEKVLAKLPIDRHARKVETFEGGPRAGRARLRAFLKEGLAAYDEHRNHPEIAGGTSLLSPYLHFGHLSPGEVAREVYDAEAPAAVKSAFLEQLVVRRELSINFVIHEPRYDRLEGAPEWARHSLRKHWKDRREHLYSEEQLERGETGDPLWNAAQLEMVHTGHMHGYVRMYWAKKLLEWTKDPDEAFRMAVLLNDRYELDGRDPNGYTGISWALGGRHDQAFGPERPVIGKIRPMTFASTSRKFDWKAYAARVESLSERAR